MDLANILNNRKRSKKKEFNEYSTVTTLVKKFKETKKESDLLAVINALEGIINTYTLMLAPGDNSQQIYITPYMKKFLGMFLTPDERANTTFNDFNQALARVRWVMRQSTYEDVYSYLLSVLIQTIKSMKIVGDCDCIYYIQLIVRYKLHDLVMKASRDATVNIADISGIDRFAEEESFEETLDRLSFSPENMKYEDALISSLYENIDISVLIRTDDIFKCFSHYEKYLIYLKDYLDLTNKQVLNILRHEDETELIERFEVIKYKLELISSEGD